MDEKFREHVVKELTKLEIFRDFRFMPSSAHKVYRNWIEARTDSPERVTRLVDEILTLDDVPTLPILSEIWLRLYPLGPGARPDCPDCSGTGYTIVERGGHEGAARCSCGAVGAA